MSTLSYPGQQAHALKPVTVDAVPDLPEDVLDILWMEYGIRPTA
jgi:hypothetical protein